MPIELPALPSTEALTLQAERIDLIPIRKEHAPAMFEVLKDPGLYVHVTGSPPDDVAALTRLYECWEGRRSPDGSELWLNWAVQLKGARQLIGHLQAGVSPDHADVAWFLAKAWHRQGYATEAAKRVVDLLVGIGVCEIRASIHPANAASIRVAERLGFHRTNEFSESELIWKRVYNSAGCDNEIAG